MGLSGLNGLVMVRFNGCKVGMNGIVCVTQAADTARSAQCRDQGA